MAIVRDGNLIAAAEEERFRRVKHWAGFPTQDNFKGSGERYSAPGSYDCSQNGINAARYITAKTTHDKFFEGMLVPTARLVRASASVLSRGQAALF